MSVDVTTATSNVTSNFTSGNISLPNITFTDSITQAYVTGSLQAVSVTFGALNSFLAIVINLLVLACILLDKELRNLTYFWNIISLCVANLLAGVTVIPLSTNIYHVGKWLHGDVICKAFIMTDYTQLPLAATILICSLLHGFGEMITSPTSRVWYAIAKSNRLRYIVTAVPWGVAVICIGVLFAGEDIERQRQRPDDLCYFVLKDEFSVPSLIIMFIGPLFLMFIVAAIALAAFMLRIRKLEPTHALRASMLPPIIMSLTYWACWMPFAVLILRFYTCKCSSSRMFYVISIIFTCAAPFLSALLSFTHPDIRRRARELWMGAWRLACSFVGDDGIIAVKWTSGDPHLIKANDSVPADF
ncbi:hypothetical protein FSP39_006860 [Pinctada imbricata]|uniref:G-protein coupled receptors family 1 profile domain-containing protein n=1 Tax=Pinctada imbricata TaxID=66713 RepID=A0AA88XLH2_PINIB|nr:hypothetical protein FSP39_006860 [Pinctada imbricata]